MDIPLGCHGDWEMWPHRPGARQLPRWRERGKTLVLARRSNGRERDTRGREKLKGRTCSQCLLIRCYLRTVANSWTTASRLDRGGVWYILVFFSSFFISFLHWYSFWSLVSSKCFRYILYLRKKEKWKRWYWNREREDVANYKLRTEDVHTRNIIYLLFGPNLITSAPRLSLSTPQQWPIYICKKNIINERVNEHQK